MRNRGQGPASKVGGRGIERPIDVKFDRTGQVMYVLDFGHCVKLEVAGAAGSGNVAVHNTCNAAAAGSVIVTW